MGVHLKSFLLGVISVLIIWTMIQLSLSPGRAGRYIYYEQNNALLDSKTGTVYYRPISKNVEWKIMSSLKK